MLELPIPRRYNRLGRWLTLVRRDRADGISRGLVAACLSLVLPGIGQLYLGRRWRGMVMLAFSLCAIAAGVWFWFLDPILLLTWLVRPSFLLALLAVDAVLLMFRLFAIFDAYRLGGPITHSGRAWAVATLTILVILTAIPHVIAGYYDYLTYDLLTEVFA